MMMDRQTCGIVLVGSLDISFENWSVSVSTCSTKTHQNCELWLFLGMLIILFTSIFLCEINSTVHLY